MKRCLDENGNYVSLVPDKEEPRPEFIKKINNEFDEREKIERSLPYPSEPMNKWEKEVLVRYCVEHNIPVKPFLNKRSILENIKAHANTTAL